MKKFCLFVKELPTLLKVLICLFTFPFGIVLAVFSFVLVPAILKGYKAQELYQAVIETPTEKTVTALMESIKNTAVNNHPDSWQSLRSLWNVVNRSNKVTTETKEKFIAMLTAKGLYLNNVRVNDNFVAPPQESVASQHETPFPAEDTAMEEARKAVTPFDHGGYVQGDGFNPSDTMAADAQRQAEQQMNDMQQNTIL